MTELTNTQRAIIEEGVKKKHSDIHELAAFSKHKPAMRSQIIQSMMRRGLLSATKTGDKSTFVLSDAAREAITKPAAAKPAKTPKASGQAKLKAKSAPAPKASAKKPEKKAAAKVSKASGKAEVKPEKTAKPQKGTKQQTIIDLLSRKEGATLAQLVKATGWQQHSVHGMMANMRKKLKLAINSTKEDGKDRVYRIAA